MFGRKTKRLQADVERLHAEQRVAETVLRLAEAETLASRTEVESIKMELEEAIREVELTREATQHTHLRTITDEELWLGRGGTLKELESVLEKRRRHSAKRS